MANSQKALRLWPNAPRSGVKPSAAPPSICARAVTRRELCTWRRRKGQRELGDLSGMQAGDGEALPLPHTARCSITLAQPRRARTAAVGGCARAHTAH